MHREHRTGELTMDWQQPEPGDWQKHICTTFKMWVRGNLTFILSRWENEELAVSVLKILKIESL